MKVSPIERIMRCSRKYTLQHEPIQQQKQQEPWLWQSTAKTQQNKLEKASVAKYKTGTCQTDVPTRRMTWMLQKGF